MNEHGQTYFFGMLSGLKYDFKDKARHVNEQVKYMFSRTLAMFDYKNLPETLPKRMLELYIQYNGFVGIYKHNDGLYAYFGGLGGKPDEYYMPTILTIANPAQGLTVNAEIHKDCVVIPNDSLYQGLRPMFGRYSTALVENQLSLEIATINTRIISLIKANDDSAKASAEKYLRDIVDGKQGVITTDAFVENLHVLPYTTPSSTKNLLDLIEQEQYLKASWFHEIGINANYNMKRENISEVEAGLNTDALLPLIDDMYNCRKLGIEEVNKLFGTEIEVVRASAWEDVKIESDLEHEEVSARAETEEETEEKQEEEQGEESDD